jgi:hypothetical protein
VVRPPQKATKKKKKKTKKWVWAVGGGRTTPKGLGVASATPYDWAFWGGRTTPKARGGFGHPHTAGMGWLATPWQKMGWSSHPIFWARGGSSHPDFFPHFNFFISKPLKKKILECSKLRRFGQNNVVLGKPKTA